MDSLLQVCFCSWDSDMQDIPSGDSFGSPLKNGHLEKLIGKGWLYSGSWKDRYCVLDGSKFYFYENEHSKGHEKNCGVINLDYYDLCEEDSAKDKRQTHVFVIGTSVRGFFDNRHQFAARSADELLSWVQAIQAAIAQARISRRRPSRKSRKAQASPTLSHSSQEQEQEERSLACLVSVAKDRNRGPQGRRLPQRKSMMPTAQPAEENDLRLRSMSMSSPDTSAVHEGDAETKKNGETKWLSLSMEDMDREEGGLDSQRSSSSHDIVGQERSRTKARHGVSLMGQHVALAKELEMKLKAGMAPGAHRPPSQTCDEEERADATGDKIEVLSGKVEVAQEALQRLEEQLDQLTSRVEASAEQAKSQVGDILLQVTVTLKEAERINGECKRALEEANRARLEYQTLARECKETLEKLNAEKEQ